MPREFVVPGETPTSAALELARTILRRAERRAVALQRDGLVPGPNLLPYLNRLADLVWVLARAAEQAESRSATPARTAGRSQSKGTSNVTFQLNRNGSELGPVDPGRRQPADRRLMVNGVGAAEEPRRRCRAPVPRPRRSSGCSPACC